MAKETSREYRPDEGMVHVVIEDEFGHEHRQAVRVLIVDKCPGCGHQNVMKGDVLDVEATITAHIDTIDAITDKKLAGFAAAGMDVKAQSAAFDEHKASKAGRGPAAGSGASGG